MDKSPDEDEAKALINSPIENPAPAQPEPEAEVEAASSPMKQIQQMMQNVKLKVQQARAKPPKAQRTVWNNNVEKLDLLQTHASDDEASPSSSISTSSGYAASSSSDGSDDQLSSVFFDFDQPIESDSDFHDVRRSADVEDFRAGQVHHADQTLVVAKDVDYQRPFQPADFDNISDSRSDTSSETAAAAADTAADPTTVRRIPDFDPERTPTQRELAMAAKHAKEFLNQQRYTNPLSKGSRQKNLSFALCFLCASLTCFFYPFNPIEGPLQTQLGIIPPNIAFISSVGAGVFFMFAGFAAIFCDHYGAAYGLWLGAALTLIGNLSLSFSFEFVRNSSVAVLCMQTACVSAGYGCVHGSILCLTLKSVANRHRAKVSGVLHAIWLLGATTTPGITRAVILAVFEVEAEGPQLLVRALYTAWLMLTTAFWAREEPSFWWRHKNWKYAPYFSATHRGRFTLKQFSDVKFVCFLFLGSFMLCALSTFPSQMGLVLGSFHEEELARTYKTTFSWLAAAASLVSAFGIDLLKWHQRPAVFLCASLVLALVANCLLLFNMYEMLLVALAFDGAAMGLFWCAFPVMMVDLYGTANLGTNLGVCFVVGGVLCGVLQTLGGEWYAQSIEDLDVECHGAHCFTAQLVWNQALICVSFILIIALRRRVKVKRDLRRKGVLSVQFFNELAETDFMRSVRLRRGEAVELESVSEGEEWRDNELTFADETAQRVFRSEAPVKKEKGRASKRVTFADETAEWSSDSQQAAGIVFSDELTEKAINTKKRKNELESDASQEKASSTSSSSPGPGPVSDMVREYLKT